MTRSLAFLLALLAAISAAVPGHAQMPPLAGTEWGLDAAGAPDRFIRFGSDGRVSGSAGCNRFTGSYEHEGARLSFGPLATTRMMCAPDVMEAEEAFLSALSRVEGIAALDPLALELAGEGGEPLLTLTRRDVD